MRKFFLCMMAAFCATTMFTACSDDDGNDFEGNGEGAGNGGSGVIVQPKKVAKIISYEDGLVEETYLFSYDSEGKLNKVITKYGSGEYANEYEKTYTYSSDKIIIKEGDEETVIQMKDGKAISYSEKEGTDYEYNYSFTYSGNYLYQVKSQEKHLQDGEWTLSSEGTDTYTVKNGNLSAVKSVWTEGKEQDVTNATIQYGNVANNANIDLGFICLDMESEDLMMLCLLGTRYQNLPASLSSKDDEGWSYKADLSYEVKEGYVTKISIKSEEKEDGGDTYSDEDVYEIIYE